jgi:DNA replication and repair protein RecF
MILRKISILNYKNIEAAQIEPSYKVNCLIGDNGVGKTNFLDALYFLSFCHSAFHSIDSQTIMHNRDFFVIEGEYANEREETELVYCGMKRGQKKHFKRNKKEYKRLSEHIGLIPLIMVSPADTELIDGGSEARRKFMDVVIAQYDNTYIDALNAYNKALQQRNALLKMEEEPDPLLLDIWEREMAQEGTRIYKARNAFVSEFVDVFQMIYCRIAQS